MEAIRNCSVVRMAVEVVEGAEEVDRLTVAEGMMLDGVLDKIK